MISAPPEAAPLSFAQEQVRLEEQVTPGTSRYVMAAALRIQGALEVPKLRRAFLQVIGRQAALRTAITFTHGLVAQETHPTACLRLPVIDADGMSAASRDRFIGLLADWNGHQPFDLVKPPLIRAFVLRGGPEASVLYVALHHIVADGWSLGILVREVAACYAAGGFGPPDLPALPISYPEHAARQREEIQGAKLERLLQFWLSRLDDIPAHRNLGVSAPGRVNSDTQSSGRVFRRLTPALTRRLEDFALSRRLTPFSVCVAGIQALLSRKAGEPAVVLGLAVAGRTTADVEPLIGLFANLVVMHRRVGTAESFADLAVRTHAEWLEIQTHQELPFELLVERLNPPREPDRPPFFDVLVNFGGLPHSRASASMLEFEALDSGIPESKFPLTIYIQPSEQGLGLCFAYRTRYFSRDSVAAMAGQYEAFLERCLENEAAPVKELSLLTRETRRVLPDPAAPMREPAQLSIRRLLALNAEARPDGIALIAGSQRYSYRELMTRARSVAARLIATIGAVPGAAVGICEERGPDLLIHMLGVMLSGAQLVMLDPLAPAPRVRAMAAASGCAVLLTSRTDADPGCPVSPLFPYGESAAELPEIDPEGPAYIFFTSGSTGIPKAVRGTHKGLSHFLSWQQRRFALGPEERFAQLTAPSFDVVLRDVLTPWVSGSTLAIPSSGERAEPHRLMNWLRDARITALHVVPSLAALWLASTDKGWTSEHLRFAFFAGEPLAGSLAARWRDAFPACQAVNLYGPTETTLAKMFYIVPSDCHDGVQPAGVPLPNTQALILNEGRQLCGIEEAGQIAIRTPFRTLGYANDEAQTQERFIQNPLSRLPRDIVYLTGDRGRYMPNGNVEILGRTDRQVKVRGVRIELDEVSAALSKLDGMESCEVCVRESRGGPELAAFFTSSQLTEADVYAHLVRVLPPSHMPGWLQLLDRMPLLPNGKIDRHALGRIDLTAVRRASREAPATAIEAAVASVWSSILGHSPSRLDHFFLCGGHSMQAARMVAALNDRFGGAMSLRTVFENPTLAGLAAAVRASADTDKLSAIGVADDLEPLLTLREGHGRIPIVCLHPGGGLAGCYHALAALLPEQPPVYGLQANWNEDGLEPYRSVESMASLYIRRLAARRIAPECLLVGWSSGGLVAFEMALQLLASGRAPLAVLLLDTGLPMETTPLPSPWDATFLASRFSRLSHLEADELEETPECRRPGKILDALRAAQVLPSAVTVEMFSTYCQFLFTFGNAKRAYVPRLYEPPALLIRASESKAADEPGFQRWRDFAPHLGTMTVPGTHYEMMRQPAVAAIAQAIARLAKGAL